MSTSTPEDRLGRLRRDALEFGFPEPGDLAIASAREFMRLVSCVNREPCHVGLSRGGAAQQPGDHGGGVALEYHDKGRNERAHVIFGNDATLTLTLRQGSEVVDGRRYHLSGHLRDGNIFRAMDCMNRYLSTGTTEGENPPKQRQVLPALSSRTTIDEDGKILLVLDNGIRIECGGHPKPGAYMMVVDRDGFELGYWNADEWGREPAKIIGQILTLAANGG